jgi:Na+-translocating ferredoxin:NAD+ oxidoreductase RnfD subunit
MRRRIRRFFRTPKGLLTAILAVLILTAWPGRVVAPGLAAAVAAAGVLDAVILRLRKKLWEYPSGAVLTAAIVVMVLREQERWYVAAAAAVIGVASKYVFRLRSANIFNPAALGIVAAYYLFHAGESWWGAQANVEGVATFLLIGTGIYIAGRVNKLPLVLTFLGSYFLLFTVAAFVRDPLSVAEIFATPDVQASLYFAVFILTDPPTSPTKYRDQIVCGVLVAAVSFACFEAAGTVYFLLAGVLVANVWEAWRRSGIRLERALELGR